MLETAMVWVGRLIGIAIVTLFVLRVMVHIKGSGASGNTPPLASVATATTAPPAQVVAPVVKTPWYRRVGGWWYLSISLVLILTLVGLRYAGIDVLAMLTALVGTVDWQEIEQIGGEYAGAVGEKVEQIHWHTVWNNLIDSDPGVLEKWFYMVAGLWFIIVGQWRSKKFDKDLFAIYVLVFIVALALMFFFISNPWERMAWFAVALIANLHYPVSGFVILIPLYIIYATMFG